VIDQEDPIEQVQKFVSKMEYHFKITKEMDLIIFVVLPMQNAVNIIQSLVMVAAV